MADNKLKDFTYLSRYNGFYCIYNEEDNKYCVELTSQLKELTGGCVLHAIKPTDTLDSLADKYYGRPDYYWVIADYNRIQDPFIILSDEYKQLLIPSLTNISFE